MKMEMPIRRSLKLWSQQLNLLASMIVGYIVTTGGADVAKILSLLPPAWSPVLGPLSGLITFLVVSYARLAVQPKLAVQKDREQ